MIKIKLEEKELRNGKTSITGVVDVRGDGEVVKYEIYAILKEFEENSPGPFIEALDLVMQEYFDKMKGEVD